MREMTDIQKKMAKDLVGKKGVFCVHTVGDNSIATNGLIKSLDAFTLDFQVSTKEAHGLTNFMLGLICVEIKKIEKKHSFWYEIEINSIEKFTFILVA